MIHFIVLTPLVLSGCVAVVLREYKQKKNQRMLRQNYENQPADEYQAHLPHTPTTEKELLRDDVTNIKHYQRMSWINLGFSGSIALFFPSLAIMGTPLLGYNFIYLLKTIRDSQSHKQKPVTTIFEIASVSASFIYGRFILCSFLLTTLFSIRKMKLQLGNMANIGISDTFNNQFPRVWILRDELEVEIELNELKKGDTLVFHKGDVIPVNGLVVSGAGKVEQYSLTDTVEIIPKNEGDWILAFSRVESGSLHLRLN